MTTNGLSTDNSLAFSHSTIGSLSDYDEYQRKLREKVANNQQTGEKSFLDTLEELRQEQRVRLARVEHEYYNQKASDIPLAETEEDQQQQQRPLITSKPPLPNASKRASSPEFATAQRARHRLTQSTKIVRSHDEEISFCPHRTVAGDSTINVNSLSTEHVQRQINNIRKELGLDPNKTHHQSAISASASWAGRITIPEPFPLTESADMNNVHRRKCMHDIETTKLKKQIEEELSLRHSFKANPIPAHVHIPLYDQLQEEQHRRREQVHQMTRNYLSTISKPFAFDARERAKVLIRRHSFSAGDILRAGTQFRAKALPDFYGQKRHEDEKLKEEELYRTGRKKQRAQDLLRQSRLPFSSEKSKRPRRSMSVNDLTRMNVEEFSFKPRTNGYYVPNFGKLHSKLVQSKPSRSPTRCKPFLLYTNLIPSKKEKILSDIQNDAELRHSQSLKIKGKPMPKKTIPLTKLSASLERHEAIPTKTTDAQRLRESIGKKKRHEEQNQMRSLETSQRSKSAKERRVRETIHQHAKLQEQVVLSKAKKDEKNRLMRQSIRQSEDDYAKKLEEMNQRVQQRPLLFEQDLRKKAVQALEKKIKHAMNLAEVTEQDLIRQQSRN